MANNKNGAGFVLGQEKEMEKEVNEADFGFDDFDKQKEVLDRIWRILGDDKLSPEDLDFMVKHDPVLIHHKVQAIELKTAWMYLELEKSFREAGQNERHKMLIFDIKKNRKRIAELVERNNLKAGEAKKITWTDKALVTVGGWLTYGFIGLIIGWSWITYELASGLPGMVIFGFGAVMCTPIPVLNLLMWIVCGAVWYRALLRFAEGGFRIWYFWTKMTGIITLLVSLVSGIVLWMVVRKTRNAFMHEAKKQEADHSATVKVASVIGAALGSIGLILLPIVGILDAGKYASAGHHLCNSVNHFKDLVNNLGSFLKGFFSPQSEKFIPLYYVGYNNEVGRVIATERELANLGEMDDLMYFDGYWHVATTQRTGVNYVVVNKASRSYVLGKTYDELVEASVSEFVWNMSRKCYVRAVIYRRGAVIGETNPPQTSQQAIEKMERDSKAKESYNAADFQYPSPFESHYHATVLTEEEQKMVDDVEELAWKQKQECEQKREHARVRFGKPTIDEEEDVVNVYGTGIGILDSMMNGAKSIADNVGEIESFDRKYEESKKEAFGDAYDYGARKMQQAGSWMRTQCCGVQGFQGWIMKWRIVLFVFCLLLVGVCVLMYQLYGKKKKTRTPWKNVREEVLADWTLKYEDGMDVKFDAREKVSFNITPPIGGVAPTALLAVADGGGHLDIEDMLRRSAYTWLPGDYDVTMLRGRGPNMKTVPAVIHLDTQIKSDRTNRKEAYETKPPLNTVGQRIKKKRFSKDLVKQVADAITSIVERANEDYIEDEQFDEPIGKGKEKLNDYEQTIGEALGEYEKRVNEAWVSVAQGARYLHRIGSLDTGGIAVCRRVSDTLVTNRHVIDELVKRSAGFMSVSNGFANATGQAISTSATIPFNPEDWVDVEGMDDVVAMPLPKSLCSMPASKIKPVEFNTKSFQGKFFSLRPQTSQVAMDTVEVTVERKTNAHTGQEFLIGWYETDHEQGISGSSLCADQNPPEEVGVHVGGMARNKKACAALWTKKARDHIEYLSTLSPAGEAVRRFANSKN